MQAVSTTKPLPGLLQRFFTKYPPKLYSAKYTGRSISITNKKELVKQRSASAESPPTPSAATDSSPEDQNTSTVVKTNPPQPQAPPGGFGKNPFIPYRTPSGWSSPRIGLRRQADLFHMARKYGVEELLPPSRKSSVFREQRVLEQGLRVRGTGEGQKVKGHKWERTMGQMVEKRIKAMEEMPEMIRLWKQRGHGRGWKKYPSGKRTS